MTVAYRTGDVTRPVEHPVILAHVSNDVGRFGGRASVATAIAARWPHVRGQFLSWSRATPAADRLGQVVFVEAEPGIQVANMVAQRGLPGRSNPSPLHLDALETCLRSVALVARDDTMGVTAVVMPRLGTGYGGHTWTEVELVITRTLIDVPVTVYDFH